MGAKGCAVAGRGIRGSDRHGFAGNCGGRGGTHLDCGAGWEVILVWDCVLSVNGKGGGCRDTGWISARGLLLAFGCSGTSGQTILLRSSGVLVWAGGYLAYVAAMGGFIDWGCLRGQAVGSRTGLTGAIAAARCTCGCLCIRQWKMWEIA